MTRACKAATERTKITPPPKKTRCGAGWCPAIADPKVVSSSHVESQRHGTFGTFAPCMCGHPSIGKFLKFCIASLHIVVWVCSSAHSGKHWPACFDQTCGYPGEGPLTTLDSLGALGMCWTPTQEICDKVRRKTKQKRGGHELCGASEPLLSPLPSPFQPRQNGLKCRKWHVWVCNAARRRGVADLHCCRMSGVASHECQSQSCSQELRSWAAKGAPRLTQGVDQAMDVQVADVQCDLQHPNERVAYRAALQVVPATLPAMPAAPMEVETGQPMQWSAGPRSSNWSWRRHCQPCEP